jgi:hypothetical protein
MIKLTLRDPLHMLLVSSVRLFRQISALYNKVCTKNGKQQSFQGALSYFSEPMNT